jgi:pimeloyl-ACP methyl ester carboxylesterase
VSAGRELTYEHLGLRVGGVDLSVATVGRGGELDPIVFLHGFGSTKEDYVDIAHQPAFAGVGSSPTTHQAVATRPARTCRKSRYRSW